MDEDVAQTKLSLEPPYKNDDGEPIPVTYEILPTGEYIYEPVETAAEKLSDDIRRIFMERGTDFFRKEPSERKRLDELQKDEGDKAEEDEDEKGRAMTAEELFPMRDELLRQLEIAKTEMHYTKELMSLLVSSANAAGGTTTSFLDSLKQPSQTEPKSQQASTSGLPPDFFSTSTVHPPQPSAPQQTFDTLVTISEKDASLRSAASIFHDAAATVERSHAAGEIYWLEALKLRRQNWALIPAPLPFGAPTGRSADRTSKDFLIFHGLSESPGIFKRRALAYLPTQNVTNEDSEEKPAVALPPQQNISLRVSLTMTDSSGIRTMSHSRRRPAPDTHDADAMLAEAQRRVVEQEIFALLIRDAGALSYATSRVSERLIELEAAQDILLRFELLDDAAADSGESSQDGPDTGTCDLVLALLPLLLLRVHAQNKARRLRVRKDTAPEPLLRILHPVVDILQYFAFLRRVHAELGAVVRAVSRAGVRTKFTFRAVGAGAEQVLAGILNGSSTDAHPLISGDAAIRIDDGRSLRFSFSAPSTLVAHLPQATLTVSSIPQLTQLLHDETEQALLERICAVGTALTEDVNGTWFVDLLMGRAVGRWEGCLLNFNIAFADDATIRCAASRLYRTAGRAETTTTLYTSDTHSKDEGTLFDWLQRTVQNALAKQP